MKIALLGNVTLDFLAQDFRRAGHDVYVPPGFDAWRQEVLDPASGLHVFAPDAVLLVMEGGVSLEDERIIGTFVDAQERVPPRQADAQERVPPVRVVVPDIAALAAVTPGFWDVRMRTFRPCGTSQHYRAGKNTTTSSSLITSNIFISSASMRS